jgi:hypothetical protein
MSQQLFPKYEYAEQNKLSKDFDINSEMIHKQLYDIMIEFMPNLRDPINSIIIPYINPTFTNNGYILRFDIYSKKLRNELYKNIHFTDVVIEECTFLYVIFFKCTFENATICKNTFSKCKFYNCKFTNTVFDTNTFIHTPIVYSLIDKSQFRTCLFYNDSIWCSVTKYLKNSNNPHNKISDERNLSNFSFQTKMERTNQRRIEMQWRLGGGSYGLY